MSVISEPYYIADKQPQVRRKVTYRTEEHPHHYICAARDRTNIGPHCHKSY